MTAASQLTAWLAEAGLRNMSLEDMIDGFSRRLNERGASVARTFVGMNTLHPMVRARSLIWDRAVPEITRFEFSHAGIDPAMVRKPRSRRCCVTALPSGYSEADLVVLKWTLPVFALAVKAVTMRALGHGLLAAYLGDDPAARVFAGTE